MHVMLNIFLGVIRAGCPEHLDSANGSGPQSVGVYIALQSSAMASLGPSDVSTYLKKTQR